MNIGYTYALHINDNSSHNTAPPFITGIRPTQLSATDERRENIGFTRLLPSSSVMLNLPMSADLICDRFSA